MPESEEGRLFQWVLSILLYRRPCSGGDGGGGGSGAVEERWRLSLHEIVGG